MPLWQVVVPLSTFVVPLPAFVAPNCEHQQLTNHDYNTSLKRKEPTSPVPSFFTYALFNACDKSSQISSGASNPTESLRRVSLIPMLFLDSSGTIA